MTPPPQLLPADQITVDPEIQARVGLDADALVRLAEAHASGAVLPPAAVFDDGATKWLAGGFHRDEVWRRAGLTEIPCIVRPGSRRDALLYAVGDNADHGLPRSREDLRRSVEILLNDAEWGQLSTNEIARLAKVHWHTANKFREEWEQRQGVTEPAERTGKDGTPRAARKPDPAPSPEPAVEPERLRAREVVGGGGERDDDSPVPILPHLTRPPAEVRVVNDHYGCPVPPALHAAWDERSVQLGHVKSLGEIRNHYVAARDDGQLSEELNPKVNTLKKCLDDAQNTIKSNLPQCVCPQCDGLRPGAGCRCKGRGWLTATHIDSLTAELRKRLERFQSRKAAQ